MNEHLLNWECSLFCEWIQKFSHFQDNYIKPREIKSSLRKVKTKEHRSVTFAGSDESFEDKNSERRLPESRAKPSLHRFNGVPWGVLPLPNIVLIWSFSEMLC